MENSKQNNALVLFVAITFICVIAIVLLVALKNEDNKPEKQPANSFAKCQVLSNSCKDKDCKYLFLCNATEFSDCKVYDCGDKYGVSVLDEQGNVKNEFKEKPDPEKVAEIVNKCAGNFEVIEKNNCVDGEARAKLKITTAGNCEILSFIMSVDKKSRIAEFERAGEFYNLSVRECGEISDIKVTGESGVAIRKKVEIPKENITSEEMMPGDFKEEM